MSRDVTVEKNDSCDKAAVESISFILMSMSPSSPVVELFSGKELTFSFSY